MILHLKILLALLFICVLNACNSTPEITYLPYSKDRAAELDRLKREANEHANKTLLIRQSLKNMFPDSEVSSRQWRYR